MRFKPAVLVAVLALFALPVLAQDEPEQMDNDVSVNFTGNVQKTATGNGLQDAATISGGFLVNARHRFHIIRLPLNGTVEANLSFTTFTQYYNPGGSQTQSNVYEASGAYVIPFKVSSPGRIKPFVEVGGGYLLFSPVGSGSVSGAQREGRPLILYGGGIDWRRYSHLGVRLGYRGLVYQAPSFSLPAQTTNAWTHMFEPYIGITYRF